MRRWMPLHLSKRNDNMCSGAAVADAADLVRKPDSFFDAREQAMVRKH